MFLKNLYFKYANKYVLAHQTIAAASEFSLTDEEYNDFCQFVIQSGFTYRLESEKYLQDLKEMVKYEGYDDLTNELLEQLTAKLQPNVETDLVRFRADVQKMLEQEIIKRYYYQHGEIEYNARFDKWLKTAIEILQKTNAKIQ
jgi:carboxyl-terminal processing protease